MEDNEMKDEELYVAPPSFPGIDDPQSNQFSNRGGIFLVGTMIDNEIIDMKVYVDPPPFPGYDGPQSNQFSNEQQFDEPVFAGVIVSQPENQTNFQPVDMPNNMILSWLTCLFCFWPVGLLAVINSYEVDRAIRKGDVDKAFHASKVSRRYGLMSIALGIAIYVSLIINLL